LKNIQIEKSKDYVLNPNHTHFLLVDDGSIGKNGVEIELRAKLENTLKQGIPRKLENEYEGRVDNSFIEKIPTILIVVNGGENTFVTVRQSIEEGVPVLVLAVCYDFFLMLSYFKLLIKE
jgi:transient receptor potential cation channel subfamily M protein 2